MYYEKKREMLLKLASFTDPERQNQGQEDEEEEPRAETKDLSWDLSKDYNAEDLPDDVARCLKYAILSLRKKI